MWKQEMCSQVPELEACKTEEKIEFSTGEISKIEWLVDSWLQKWETTAERTWSYWWLEALSKYVKENPESTIAKQLEASPWILDNPQILRQAIINSIVWWYFINWEESTKDLIKETKNIIIFNPEQHPDSGYHKELWDWARFELVGSAFHEWYASLSLDTVIIEANKIIETDQITLERLSAIPVSEYEYKYASKLHVKFLKNEFPELEWKSWEEISEAAQYIYWTHPDSPKESFWFSSSTLKEVWQDPRFRKLVKDRLMWEL